MRRSDGAAPGLRIEGYLRVERSILMISLHDDRSMKIATLSLRRRYVTSPTYHLYSLFHYLLSIIDVVLSSRVSVVLCDSVGLQLGDLRLPIVAAVVNPIGYRSEPFRLAEKHSYSLGASKAHLPDPVRWCFAALRLLLERGSGGCGDHQPQTCKHKAGQGRRIQETDPTRNNRFCQNCGCFHY